MCVADFGAERPSDGHGALVGEVGSRVDEYLSLVVAVEGGVAMSDVDFADSDEFRVAGGFGFQETGVCGAFGVGAVVDEFAGEGVKGARTDVGALSGVYICEFVKVV